jgi:hypothetical protein
MIGPAAVYRFWRAVSWEAARAVVSRKMRRWDAASWEAFIQGRTPPRA